MYAPHGPEVKSAGASSELGGHGYQGPSLAQPPHPCQRLGSDLATAGKGPGNGDLVGILEIAAGRKTVGQSAHPHPGAGKALAEVMGGGLPLHIGIGGDDDLLHRPVRQASQELPDAELVRPHPVDGRECSLEDVVDPAELPAAFHREDIQGRLDNTELAAISLRVGADRAELAFAEEVTVAAAPDGVPEAVEGVAEAVDVVGIGPHAMEREPLRGLGPDPRKPA